MRADGLQAGQGVCVFIDGALQFGAGVADVGRVDEDGGDAGRDHGGCQRADAGHVQVVDHVAGGKHRIIASGRVEKCDLDFGGREGHAVQLEVAGFLHLAVAHGHLGVDALGRVGLPDTNVGVAVLGDAVGVDQPHADGRWPDRGGQIAAGTAPVHHRLVDVDLPEQVIHVMAGLVRSAQDHALAGAGRRPAHAIGVLGVGVGAADDAQQQGVACRAGLPRGGRQIVQIEEHALGRAATQVGCGDLDLRGVGHSLFRFADSARNCTWVLGAV